MPEVSVADAKAHLSKLIEQVEQGGSVDITKRGKPVARLSPVAAPRVPVDVAALRALTDTMAPQAQSAADFVRGMRDGERA